MNARYSNIVRPVHGANARHQINDGLHIIWRCPYCPWYRVRTNKGAWEQVIIVHPNYGPISNFDAFMRDIQTHDCKETREARLRYGMSTTREFTIQYQEDDTHVRSRPR